MNAIKLTSFVVAATLLSTTALQAAHAQGKSREEVRQELIRAQHEGIVPYSKTQYPGTDVWTTRNKQLHALSTHSGETSPALDRHDDIVVR